MAIKPTKTQLMIHKPNTQDKEITMQVGGKTIRHQRTLKILGFTFAEDKKMDTYIWKGDQNLIRTINTKTHMLRVIRPYTTRPQLANIGNMLINSQIRYLATLWSLTGTTNTSKIQAAQTRAARAISWPGRKQTKDKISRQDLFQSLGWPNVLQIAHNATVTIVRQATCNRSATGINSMFSTRKGTQKRNQHKHTITTKNTSKRKGSNFLDCGRKQYNQLPLQLRDTTTSKYMFKKGLKSHLAELHHLPRHVVT